MDSVLASDHVCDGGAGGCGFFGNFGLGFWVGILSVVREGEVSWSMCDEVEEEREMDIPGVLRYVED